jgi:hypothetical protein
MPRWRVRSRRALTNDQRSFLLSGGLFLRTYGDGETTDDVANRLFGGWRLARAAWELHRDDLMVADPLPGHRPFAWWQWEAPKWEPRHQPTHRLRLMQHPPTRWRRVPYDQPAILRRHHLLTELEERQLRAQERRHPAAPEPTS